MTLEAPRPTNEPLKPAEFYNPVTDNANALKKLTVLSMREPTDVELFEAIADTFATIATTEFNAGDVDSDGFSALEWKYTDEVIFITPQSDLTFVGYSQQQAVDGLERSEQAFIEGYSLDEQSPGNIVLKRDVSGEIKAFIFDTANSNQDVEYSIPKTEKKKIIEALLQGLSSKAPIAA